MRRTLRVLAWTIGASATIATLLVVGLLTARAWYGDSDVSPEAATGRREVEVEQSKRFMVVAAHPLAAEAGRKMLEEGGAAIDAAVAVQAMLTLVEPQSSGIGGGAFLLHFDPGRGELDAFDGREEAPSAATSTLFVHEDGDPYDFIEALVGGRSVGVPGVLRMLEDAHRWHGKLPWKKAFEPAIEAAELGFEVTPRLHRLLARAPLLRAMPAARRLYYQEDGRAKPTGEVLKNPELAKVLREIAIQGADAFYQGPIAEAMVRAVKGARQPTLTTAAVNKWMLDFGFPFGSGWMASASAPGLLELEDLRTYEAELRKPVCIEYRAYKVCGHPPPTSGGVTTLQILGLLSHFDLSSMTPNSSEATHLLAEAGRLAFADRAAYVGDPAFVDVPVARLLAPDYLAERAKLIDPSRARPEVSAGRFANYRPPPPPDTSPSFPSTSHFNVVDAEGRVVSMTTSVEMAFGSQLVVNGFLLNNQLTDFSFVPTKGGEPVANAVAAGKRPRSSMSPLIVFDKASGRPVLAVGSAGGSRIIGFVVQAAVGVLDWGLDPQAALNLPHVLCRGGPVELENEGWPPGALPRLVADLESLGHRVRVVEMNSGLHALKIGPEGFQGGVDPRREGVALGERDGL